MFLGNVICAIDRQTDRQEHSGSLGETSDNSTRDRQHGETSRREEIRAQRAEVGFSAYTFLRIREVSKHKPAARL